MGCIYFEALSFSLSLSLYIYIVKSNHESKPALLRLKFDLVSYPTHGGDVGLKPTNKQTNNQTTKTNKQSFFGKGNDLKKRLLKLQRIFFKWKK